jgi:peptidoglycan/LPS O-acetylase OafA/YrhL
MTESLRTRDVPPCQINSTVAIDAGQLIVGTGVVADPGEETRPRRDSKAFYIPSLDGFRALAILLVFLAHAGLDRFVPGGFGVTIFFFLSGYLITTLLRREFERTQAINLKHFYLRRMLRIWPAFYFVLLSGAALTALQVLPGRTELIPTLAQLLHVANYYSIFFGSSGMTAGTMVFWSLAVEEHFYLVFPFFCGLLLQCRLAARQRFMILLATCALVLAWRFYLVLVLDVSTDRTYFASDTRLDNLLFGCALALYGNPMLDGKPRREALLKYLVVPIAVALLLCSFIFRSETFRETFRYTIQGVALFPVFVAAIAFPHWALFRWLNTGVLRFMGTISYSFYLVHFVAIAAVQTHFGHTSKWVQGGISFVLSIVVAYAMYRFLELPLARMRRKLAVT